MSGLRTDNIFVGKRQATGKQTAIPWDNQRKKTKALQRHHTELFKKEGVLNPKFIPRTSFSINEVLVIAFYEKYLHGDSDVYIEFCSKDLTPEYPRTLYKWEFRKDFLTFYGKTEKHPATQKPQIIIPVKDLINVTEYYEMLEAKPAEVVIEEIEKVQEEVVPEKVVKELVSLPSNAELDLPALTGLSIRDFAAIIWKQPVSNKQSLNALITDTFNDD